MKLVVSALRYRLRLFRQLSQRPLLFVLLYALVHATSKCIDRLIASHTPVNNRHIPPPCVRKRASLMFTPCISINHAEVQGRRDLRSFDTSQEVSGGKCMCSHVVAQTPPRPLAIFNGTIPGIILFAHQQFHLFLLLNVGVGLSVPPFFAKLFLFKRKR